MHKTFFAGREKQGKSFVLLFILKYSIKGLGRKMVYPTDEETFDNRVSPEFVRDDHLNLIQAFLKRIQDFLGYGGRLNDITGLVMPVGAIMPYTGLTAPTGFLCCDGREYDGDNADYSDLYTVIGNKYGNRTGNYFNVPDLRHTFLRGWSSMYEKYFIPARVDTATDIISHLGWQFTRTGIPVRFRTLDTLPAPLVADTTYYAIFVESEQLRFATSRANAFNNVYIDLTTQGVSTHYVRPHFEDDEDTRLKLAPGGNDGADLGSYQEDIFQGHWHYIKDSGTGNYYDNDGPDGAGAQTMKIHAGQPGASSRAGNISKDPALPEPRFGVETRPKNVYVNYIIKR